MTTPARDPQFKGRQSTLTWTVNDPDPTAFRDLFEGLTTTVHCGLPGSRVESIEFKGSRLTVTLVDS